MCFHKLLVRKLASRMTVRGDPDRWWKETKKKEGKREGGREGRWVEERKREEMEKGEASRGARKGRKDGDLPPCPSWGILPTTMTGEDLKLRAGWGGWGRGHSILEALSS